GRVVGRSAELAGRERASREGPHDHGADQPPHASRTSVDEAEAVWNFAVTPEAVRARNTSESFTMTVDLLELSVLQPARDGLGFIASFAITEQLIVAAGGTSSETPIVIASSNARHFEPRRPPRELGLRDALAVDNTLWLCGEYGQL